MAKRFFNGEGILVTRPADQSRELLEGLRALRAHPVQFPGVEIVPLLDGDTFNRTIGEVDFYVFVSRNAAKIGGARLSDCLGAEKANCNVAAVGLGTKQELNRLGFDRVLVPSLGQDSEALAYTIERQITNGDTVMIVKGEGGSDRIRQILSKQVSALLEVNCYRRDFPRYSEVPDLESVGKHGVSAWTATSSEIVHNIFSIFKGNHQDRLRNIPIFVTHPRIGLVAQCYGVREIVMTAPGNANIISGLLKWFR